MTRVWAEGVAAGAPCIACSTSGYWLRARVLTLGPASAKVSFAGADERVSPWLPRLTGLGDEVSTVGPERVAPSPDALPRVLPPVGSHVIVLWDAKRFHPALLVRQ